MISVRSNLKVAPKGVGVYLYRSRKWCRRPEKPEDITAWSPWKQVRIDPETEQLVAAEGWQNQVIGPIDLDHDQPFLEAPEKVVEKPVAIEDLTEGQFRKMLLGAVQDLVTAIREDRESAQKPAVAPISSKPSHDIPDNKIVAQPEPGAVVAPRKGSEPMPEQLKKQILGLFARINLQLVDVERIVNKPASEWTAGMKTQLIGIYGKHSGEGKRSSSGEMEKTEGTD